nr:phytochrome-associated serine/threonine protein phosphatase [Tanacetum cinerariifolium]
ALNPSKEGRMDLDLWITKVKEGQHLSEDELQLLCEYKERMVVRPPARLLYYTHLGWTTQAWRCVCILVLVEGCIWVVKAEVAVVSAVLGSRQRGVNFSSW